MKHAARFVLSVLLVGCIVLGSAVPKEQVTVSGPVVSEASAEEKSALASLVVAEVPVSDSLDGGQAPSGTVPGAPATATECRAAILIYHHINPHAPGEGADVRAMTVAPAALDKQLKYLSEHDYAVVPFGSVVDCVVKRLPLPEKAVVITFDDGWASQYANALPLLEKYGMTATFFVVTDYVGVGGAILSWDQIKTLDAKGMTIASHSRTHPFLTRADAGRLRHEVAGSKKAIEDHIGKPVLYFAYPFGSVDPRVTAAVRTAGYAAARGTYEGTRHVPGDLFVLKGVYVTDSLDRFAREIAR